MLERAFAETFPESAASTGDLEAFGKVVEVNSHWCVLLYFAPAEGLGYGRAVIYRKMKSLWQIHETTEEILLPAVRLSQGKIVVSKEASLNDSTRVEVMHIDISQ